MDKDRQAGIKVEAIILVESFFKRMPDMTSPVPLKFEINVSNNIDSEKNQLVTEMKVNLNGESDRVFGHFIYVGIFSAGDGGIPLLQEFAEHNAPACLFPYLREEIQNRSVKAGLPPIIMQPLNTVVSNTCH